MSVPASNVTAPTSAAPTQNQDRLKAHFAGHADSAHPSRWDDLWKAGDFLPWDRGYANPAFIDYLIDRQEPLDGPLRSDGSRKKALVPGCGKGYDLALLAAHGYDAIGLEISENAVEAAKKYLEDPGEGKEGEYKVKHEKIGKGKTEVVLGDFFKDDWTQAVDGLGEGFDLIYDNTFLSALPLSLRPAWALRMTQLLAHYGTLICLEFPTHKPPLSGGPPFALPSEVYEELFKRPGEEILYDDAGKVVKSEKAGSINGLERADYYKPRRTHQVGIVNGEVKDFVSAWMSK